MDSQKKKIDKSKKISTDELILNEDQKIYKILTYLKRTKQLLEKAFSIKQYLFSHINLAKELQFLYIIF